MRLELAPLLRSLRPPRGPGGSFPSPSGMAQAPERSPRSAARGVQTRPRLQRRSRATASRASPPTHNLASLPSSGVRPEPAAGQLPLPREPAAGSRGPGRSEARGGGGRARRRWGAGWAATCEQKYEPWMPSLMQVGHWSLASLLQPSVSQTRVSTAAMLPACRRRRRRSGREERPREGTEPAQEELGP